MQQVCAPWMKQVLDDDTSNLDQMDLKLS